MEKSVFDSRQKPLFGARIAKPARLHDVMEKETGSHISYTPSASPPHFKDYYLKVSEITLLACLSLHLVVVGCSFGVWSIDTVYNFEHHRSWCSASRGPQIIINSGTGLCESL